MGLIIKYRQQVPDDNADIETVPTPTEEALDPGSQDSNISINLQEMSALREMSRRRNGARS